MRVATVLSCECGSAYWRVDYRRTPENLLLDGTQSLLMEENRESEAGCCLNFQAASIPACGRGGVNSYTRIELRLRGQGSPARPKGYQSLLGSLSALLRAYHPPPLN